MSKILTEFQEDLQPLLEDYLRANSEYWKEYQDQFRELFDKDFYQKQREEIMSTGYVVDSLKASLWCLGTTETFEGAALKAVNLGNDTDTIGGITGSFAGALYKLEGIPDKWGQQLVNRELIDEKCQKLIECLGQLDLFMNVEYLLSLLDDLAEKNFYYVTFSPSRSVRCETKKPPAMRVRIEGYTKKTLNAIQLRCSSQL